MVKGLGIGDKANVGLPTYGRDQDVSPHMVFLTFPLSYREKVDMERWSYGLESSTPLIVAALG